MDIEELKERASKEYEAIKLRKRELYKLARDLGFSPIESKILSGTSETEIKDLAKKSPLSNPPLS